MSNEHALRARTTITLVTAPGCHFCEDAHQALAEVASRDHTVEVRLVEAASPLGMALAGEHRPSMYPLVLVDGRCFSTGRLPRRKLEALLSQRADRVPNGVQHG